MKAEGHLKMKVRQIKMKDAWTITVHSLNDQLPFADSYFQFFQITKTNWNNVCLRNVVKLCNIGLLYNTLYNMLRNVDRLYNIELMASLVN